MNNMLESYSASRVTYLSIVSGKLAKKVQADTPGATKREYEIQGGAKKIKYELYYKSVSGQIIGLEFKDGDFGEQFMITLSKEGAEVKITMPSSSGFFTDFSKKLPNIALGKEVTLSVFDFESDKGKRIKGFTIYQDAEKATNFYFDFDKKKTINGFPTVSDKDMKSYDKDDWKMYFMKVKKFLKEKVVEQSKDIVPVLSIEELPGDEISVEDLPF